MKIRLSHLEHAFMVADRCLPAPLMSPFDNARRNPGRVDTFTIQLDRQQAHTIREALFERLLVIGFGNDDEPTAEGRIIEDLIDKFQARDESKVSP